MSWETLVDNDKGREEALAFCRNEQESKKSTQLMDSSEERTLTLSDEMEMKGGKVTGGSRENLDRISLEC